MKPTRSSYWLVAGIIVCHSLFIFDSSAQSYPVKPIHIFVGFPAGTATDTTARIVAQKLPERLGQPVVVENRAGASGTIATAKVATSPADGYTLLLLTAADTAQPALRARLPYDLERDLAPVSLVVRATFVLVVHPSVPARDVRELIALARSQPGKLNFASSGVGSTLHLAGELFNMMAKVNVVHVSYKGATEAVTATASGQIDMSFPALSTAAPLLNAGKVRGFAVTSANRTSLMPSIPTLNESGLPGYERTTWFGISAPAGVPKDIIAQLNAVIAKVVNTPEMRESFVKQGLDPQTNSPEQFAVLIHRGIAQNAELIKFAGMKAE